MVALIPAAFSALFSSGTAAAGAGAAAAGTAAAGTAAAAGTSLFSASTIGTLLSGGASLVGAMAALRKGQDEADQLNLQAVDTDRQAGQADIDAENRQNSLRRGLIKQIGEQDVAYAASGLDLSFGTAAQARADAEKDAANALTTDTENEAATKLALARRAQQYRMAAKQARSAGMLSAIGTGIGAAADIFARG